ncbi:hypothetical protein EV196_10586 [Mariniflexile fucanivorans]|uniref:Tetratricopeptide repeat protein n=1 Tax=Mariniflexile fucanivorans TaxID=264023 RepID=A0A4R1RHL9_9FLAO|nr:hypothetical protein [Mariniflexile fucanivorans]TCL65429.1 hypothetical protein EV196_10586 [Mariniflexile fucanivorans]
MNSTDFTYLLQHPQSITHQQTEAVKSIIDEFPYFQSARALYLKGLKNQSSFKYNQELKTTAAYTADRSILFDFITSDVFVQNEISELIKQNTAHLQDIEIDIEDISVNKKVTSDDRLKQQIMETIGVLDPMLFRPKQEEVLSETDLTLEVPENSELEIEETETQEPVNTAILNLGKPFDFNKRETHSFNEWLNLTRLQPIEREENTVEAFNETDDTENTSNIEKLKKFELIEEFINKNPKINPSTFTPSKVNLAEAQMIQPESLMTETLARIYVEQKNYKKAIQSYKILSLKYPEKSGFFADQIKAVEQLQEQNNKK